MTTKSYIVIKDKPQVLTNKTIDSDDNIIQNLEVGNLKNTAVSLTIPTDSTGVDTKLPTEKAVKTFGDGKLDKQYTTAEDGYVAKVDPVDHVLKPMDISQLSDVQVVDTLPATGSVNTLYVVETAVTILHKYSLLDPDYIAQEDGVYTISTGVRLYTYDEIESRISRGLASNIVEIDDENGTIVRYSNNGVTACTYYLNPLHSGRYTQYVWRDSEFATASIPMDDFLKLVGGTMSGTINFTTNSSTPAIKGSASYDMLISGGSVNHGVNVCGGTTMYNGASLSVYGLGDSSNAGVFKLWAIGSSGSGCWLTGTPNDLLTWNGNHIAFNGVHDAPRFGNTSDDKSVSVSGGSDYSSAYLQLYGKSRTYNAGWFRLKAYDGTNSTELLGKPDGTLTWGGKNVLTKSITISTEEPSGGEDGDIWLQVE